MTSQLIVIDMRSRAAEVQVVHATGRNDMQMAVGNLESGNDQPDTLALESSSERATDPLGDDHEMRGEVRLEVTPLVGVDSRNDQTMSGGNGIN